MFFVVTCCVALQVHGWFRYKDVQHLINPRVHKYLAKGRIEYGDWRGFDSMIASSRIPTHVVVVSEQSHIHFFLHDTQKFRRCLWDGRMAFDEKKNITLTMMKWWQNATELECDHRMFDFEDGAVFTTAQAELNAQAELEG